MPLVTGGHVVTRVAFSPTVGSDSSIIAQEESVKMERRTKNLDFIVFVVIVILGHMR